MAVPGAITNAASATRIWSEHFGAMALGRMPAALRQADAKSQPVDTRACVTLRAGNGFEKRLNDHKAEGDRERSRNARAPSHRAGVRRSDRRALHDSRALRGGPSGTYLPRA